MTESKSRQERRSEVRRRAPAARISWTREDAARTCSGWVNDVAPSSISFVTPNRDLPAPGEAIELTWNAGGPSPQYHSLRVARTAPHDRLFSLVACRTLAAAEQSHDGTLIRSVLGEVRNKSRIA